MRFWDFLKTKYPSDYRYRGVEIGVFEGENVLLLCDSLEFELLYLVDPYLKYVEYTNYCGYSQEEWSGIERGMRVSLNIGDDGCGNYRGRPLRFIKALSSVAVSEVDDGSLDFVYADGNHEYEYIKEDIKLWYPKLKVGGWMMGHDWPVSEDSIYMSIKRAATEFVEENDLKFDPLSHRKGYTEWWFQKK